MNQLTLDLEPGLLDRFPALTDALVATVYSGRKAQKSIAYDLDESPSSLSRKVKGDLEFPLSKLSELIDSTGDKTIIYWLIEKHLVDADEKKGRALSELEGMLPQIRKLLEQAAG